MAAIFQDGRHFRYAIPYNFDTVRHVMDKIRDAVRLLNPGQVPVITADQPIYATASRSSGSGLRTTAKVTSSSCSEDCTQR